MSRGHAVFLLFLVVCLAAGFSEAAARGQNKSPAQPEVRLDWRNGQQELARLVSLRGDSLIYEATGDSSRSLHATPLTDLESLTIVHHASMTPVVISTAVAGAAGALIGFASGDDPPGWFSLTAEQKAFLLGVSFSSITFGTGSFIQAIRARDDQIPLTGVSPQKRREIVRQVLAGTYRTPHPVSLVVSPLLNWYGGSAFAAGFAGGLWYRFRSHVILELTYEGNSWSRWETTDHTSSPGYEYIQRTRRRSSHLIGRALFLSHRGGVVRPYFGAGCSVGHRTEEHLDRNLRRDPDTGQVTVDSYRWDEGGGVVGVPVDVGILARLAEPLTLDLRVERFLTYDTPWVVSVGLAVRVTHGQGQLPP